MATPIKKDFPAVQAIFADAGMRIEKDQSEHTYLWYFVFADGCVHSCNHKGGMSEVYDDVANMGPRKWLDGFRVGDVLEKGWTMPPQTKARTGGGNGVKAAAKPKGRIQHRDIAFTPSALKRRLRNDDGGFIGNDDGADVGVAEVAVTAEPARAGVITTVADMEEAAFQAPATDYSVSVPKRSQDGYYFPEFTNNAVLRAKLGRNILVSGKAGCGKSEFVMNLAKIMGVRCVRINFQVGTTEAHLVGKFTVKDGATKFVYGVLPLAMKNGWWLLFDELDYAMPEHLCLLHPVLEGDDLVIMQNESERVTPHENFRMFATANTKGRGDETQGYAGTNFLNLAFLDRWAIFECDYTAYEKQIAESILGDSELAGMVDKLFKLMRKSVEAGEIMNAVFSTRRMVQLCETIAAGEPLADAIHFELLSRYDKHEVEVLREHVFDVFEKEFYMKGWKIGDVHKAVPAN